MILNGMDKLKEVEAGKRILVLDKCGDWDVFLVKGEGFHRSGSSIDVEYYNMLKYYKGFKILNSENVEIV